ncbi:MAG: hypothetical protein DWQ19_11390 [Crenarchaeota archaeon]|nr:MAG: hypothetical protein DWQ19_11390 [Thermoproteota archaeon]
MTLLVAFTPSEVPKKIDNEVPKQEFKFERTLLVKVSGNGDPAELQAELRKLMIQHQVERVMLHGDGLKPLLVPAAIVEHIKEHVDNVVDVEEMIENAGKPEPKQEKDKEI